MCKRLVTLSLEQSLKNEYCLSNNWTILRKTILLLIIKNDTFMADFNGLIKQAWPFETILTR